ncbi:lipoprotein-anchoring transpeptidase ErfK/SrfK [Catenulispora sp. GP43]|uniref:L,D-transpeptidase n=1 Tax=Catenulispora sp. GP43 TaxID=3156263 RepID=UPI003514A9EF
MATTPDSASRRRDRQRPTGARRAAIFLAACSAVFAVAAPSTAEAAATRAVSPHCPQLTRKVVCVDQNHQTLWVQQGHKVVFPAVRIRTGMPGRRTPDGLFHIWLRNRHQYSHLFHEPMPFSSFFHGDYALHGTYQDVRRGGSNGCVNLTVADSARLFPMLGLGDVVYIWGHKPR